MALYKRFFNTKSYSGKTELIFLTLTYNPLVVSLSSAQLLNVVVQGRSQPGEQSLF